MVTLNPFFIMGVVALAAVLEVALIGERAVPNAGLHPHMTRATVYAARVALAVLVVLCVVAWLR